MDPVGGRGRREGSCLNNQYKIIYWGCWERFFGAGVMMDVFKQRGTTFFCRVQAKGSHRTGEEL